MSGAPSDLDRVMVVIRRSVLSEDEVVSKLRSDRSAAELFTTNSSGRERDYFIQRLDWPLAREPWLHEGVLVEQTMDLSHGGNLLRVLLFAQDGSEYVLGAVESGETDLLRLAARLFLPEGQAPSPRALAEVIAYLEPSSLTPGYLVEGSFHEASLLERYPEAREIEAWLHDVRLEDSGDQARLEFFSYTPSLGGPSLEIIVRKWFVQADADGTGTITHQDFAILTIAGPFSEGSVRLLS
ncbi:hypothetical protein KIH74_04235 [Kineosporia sp. J2-2]|uniref:EF-hand domain-containing protein n=1 Tax=Kineosporia corallincola TaxID=2835133 RepID=A0ABS5TD46_9ACTN|nr:hypothetical protein [Kineosporia corallincola]MBT0768116.1 hypothetical protein [Kineosporia corallincola]